MGLTNTLSRHYNLLARVFRAGFVLIIEWARAALRNRGPGSELSANFLARCESGAAAFVARFWPVWSGLGSGLGLRDMGWVYARTLIPPECHQNGAIREQPTSLKILANR